MLIMVLIAVVVLLGLALALSDRTLAAVAERRAAASLAASFGQVPTVRVYGRPFLSQALRGRYALVEVSGGGLRLGEIANVTVTARLSNLLLPAADLWRRRATELPCERVCARLVLPYGELARVSRVPGLDFSFADGRLLASASLPVPGIGPLARVSGHARLTVDGDTVWLHVSDVSMAGLGLTALVIGQLLPQLNVPIPLPSLPWGLRVGELHPMPEGLLVTASAAAVVLRPVSQPGRSSGVNAIG